MLVEYANRMYRVLRVEISLLMFELVVDLLNENSEENWRIDEQCLHVPDQPLFRLVICMMIVLVRSSIELFK